MIKLGSFRKLSHFQLCCDCHLVCTLCACKNQLWKFNKNWFFFFSNPAPTWLTRNLDVGDKSRWKHFILTLGATEVLQKIFDLATTKIAHRYIPDEKQHIPSKAREHKTESSDNSPEQMIVSSIWSITALTNKWCTMLFGSPEERLEPEKKKGLHPHMHVESSLYVMRLTAGMSLKEERE